HPPVLTGGLASRGWGAPPAGRRRARGSSAGGQRPARRPPPEDLGPSGQALWTADAPRRERLAHWGPLLRSQQQHLHMCTAQHLHTMQAQREKAERAAQAADELTCASERSGDQARELEMLRQQLRQVQDETERLRAQRESAQLSRRQEAERSRQEEAERQLRARAAERSAEA
ncbi:unnamed protein product, partial [Prorocentrum cordatum]